MLGDRLKTLREKKGITQVELAKELKMSRGTYAHYELNKREPDNETLLKLAKYFATSVDYLLGVSEEPGRTDSGFILSAEQVIAHAEKMNLNQEQLAALEILKKLPLSERQVKVAKAISDLYALPEAEAEAVLGMIKALASRR